MTGVAGTEKPTSARGLHQDQLLELWRLKEVENASQDHCRHNPVHPWLQENYLQVEFGTSHPIVAQLELKYYLYYHETETLAPDRIPTSGLGVLTKTMKRPRLSAKIEGNISQENLSTELDKIS